MLPFLDIEHAMGRSSFKKSEKNLIFKVLSAEKMITGRMRIAEKARKALCQYLCTFLSFNANVRYSTMKINCKVFNEKRH
jgi:hypothetical protein